jgi:hypothetical protein
VIEADGIDAVINAVEHEDAFFSIYRNGECVAVMITPALFEELSQIKNPDSDFFTIYQRGKRIGIVSNELMPEPVVAVHTRGLAPEVW